MSQPPDPLEFLKSLWGPMGLPMSGLSPAASASSEVERRIAELKAVENWLNINLSVLRMTIQGLEMQKAGLAAMQGGQDSTAPSPQSPGGEGKPEK